MTNKKIIPISAAMLFALSLVASNFVIVHRVSAARSIIFPVIGPASFSNDYTAPRGNRLHLATDIMAKKGQKLVAAVDGIITRVNYPQPNWGYSIDIEDSAGYTYSYLHMNDDRPGTNDGRGGGMGAYATDMKVGNPVVKGQLLGWVGDSGKSGGVPHLHFEMYDPSNNPINPYHSLVPAKRLSTPTAYPKLPDEVLPYGTNFPGGASIAAGNFDGDEEMEYVTGAGPGGGPHIKLYDDDDTFIRGFYAYNPSFSGGVDVAVGDVDDDDIDEIVTGAGAGGGPHIKAFEANGTQIRSFMAYSPNFTNGVRVSTGDLDGDDTDEIITGAGAGGGPHVKAFRADGSQASSFFAYSPDFAGGVDVAGGNVTGGSDEEIVVSPGAGGNSQIKVFNMDASPVSSFTSYRDFNGGVRVSVGDVTDDNSNAEILTVPVGGPPNLIMFAWNGYLIDSMPFMERWWIGYHDVAAGDQFNKVSTGVNRRTSLRDGFELD